MKHIKIKKKKTLLESPLFLVIMFALVILLVIPVARTFSSYRSAQQTFRDNQDEQERLELQEINLRENIEYFQTERGREELIRLQHPVVKDGEELIIIIPDDQE